MVSCYLKLKESIGNLSNSEKKVAKYVIDFPQEIVSMPIEQLAQNCGTSKSAVVRFCKSMGYKGYKEFCIQLNADLAQTSPESVTYRDILPKDDLRSIVANVTENNIKSLENTLNILNYDELELAVSAIANAKRVDFYGCGNSGLVALDAQNKFMRINKYSNAQIDPHMQIAAAANLTKGDVAVLISYTGETRDILETMELIKRTGATTISITRYGKNSLSEMAQIKLFTPSLETLIRSGAKGSRIGQLNLIDIIFSAVASREYSEIKIYLDRTSFAYRKKKSTMLEE